MSPIIAERPSKAATAAHADSASATSSILHAMSLAALAVADEDSRAEANGSPQNAENPADSPVGRAPHHGLIKDKYSGEYSDSAS